MIRNTVYIGLGSNLQNPEKQIKQALEALNCIPQCSDVCCSPWYRSIAIGPGNQPDYINAVAQLKTSLSPQELLQRLQVIENNHGRQREIHWGARTLDLDLLLYSDVCMTTNELQLPHPEIMNRNFVLYPLRDLSPTLKLPNGQCIADVVKGLTMSGLTLVTADSTTTDSTTTIEP